MHISNDLKRRVLVVVDPQNDFCHPKGSLFVPGADTDMMRLAEHIKKHGRRYCNIYVSLDSHDPNAIFHPRYWMSPNGIHPEPFTPITRDMFTAGEWRPSSPLNDHATARTFDVMERRGFSAQMIWPEHCVVSTWGHQICDTILEAFDAWREATGNAVRYIFKGEFPYTEQFSIFEGLDNTWPEARFREDLFTRLSMADSVTFGGEAISHCVEESIVSYASHAHITGLMDRQVVEVLTDCTSAVTGFDRAQSESRIVDLGVSLASSTDL